MRKTTEKTKNTKGFYLTLSPTVHRKLKAVAALENRTMSDVLRVAAENYSKKL